jgi:predicted TIM-barrel fold metal-dependent hydrolase
MILSVSRRKPIDRMTRRGVLLGAAALVGFGKASQPATAVNFSIPPNASDCHTHIFGDPKQFPLWSGRSYTPETALPAEMSALHRVLHMMRVVIVTPSVYGVDNSATIYGMKARGKDARGVAVIDEHTSEHDLDSMGIAGIRGIRLNLASSGQNSTAAARQLFQAAAERMKRRNWHVQMYTNLAIISGIKDLVQSSPTPVVFDHFGGAQAAQGLEQPGFADLVELVRSGKAYVKISGAYRASTQAPDYADVTPFAEALIAANADRIVWGTDWPHPGTAVPNRPLTELTPLTQIDDGRLLNQLAVWAPDAAVRKKILVDNPARLYGF